MNPRGHSTYMRYDLLGRQTHTIDALGGVSYMGYDANGNVVRQEGPEEASFYGVFWVTGAFASAVSRSNLDGTGTTSVFDGTGDLGITAVACNSLTAGGNVYWIANNDRLIRANFDGSNRAQLLDSTSMDAANSLAVDGARGRVFFAQLSGTADIKTANLDGTALQTVVSVGDIALGLSVDPRDGRLFYTKAFAGEIHAINPDGSNDATVVSGLTLPFGLDIDRKHRKLYWVENGTQIRRADMDGSNVETVLSGLSSMAGTVAVDPVRDRVYWGETTPNDIIRWAKLDGSDVATILNDASALALALPQRVTLSTYDGLNRQSKIIDAVGSQTYMGYDSRSSAVLRVDADGRATYRAYDVARRLERQFHRTPVAGEAETSPTYFVYDQVSNVKIVDDRLAGLNVTYFDHDVMDRVVKKVTLAGATYHEYDLSGMKVAFKDADLSKNYYVYDAAGRLVREWLDDARTAYFHHDLSGRITTKILPQNSSNKLMTYHAYDVAGRLSRLESHAVLGGVSGLITYFSYQRDANGQPTWIRNEDDQNTYHEYDALNRLTLDERKSSSATLYGFRYAYDAAGNRDRKVTIHESNSRTYYVYDTRNLLMKEGVEGAGTAIYYDFDNARRMSAMRPTGADVQSAYFAHDQRNRATGIAFTKATSPDTTRSFGYSGAGERVFATDDTTTYWQHDGHKLVREGSTAGAMTRRYRRSDPVEVGLTGPFKVYPATDEQGSVRKFVDNIEGGVVGQSYTDQFGVKLAEENDPSVTGLAKVRTRWLGSSINGLNTTNDDFYLTAAGIYLPGPGVMAQDEGEEGGGGAGGKPKPKPGEPCPPPPKPPEGWVWAKIADCTYMLVRITPAEPPTYDECVKACVADALGIKDLVAGGAGLSGLPIKAKPRVGVGARADVSPVTSPISSLLSRAMPRRLSFQVPAPRWSLARPLVYSNVVGRILGRWIPFVGWGLLAYDSFSLISCLDDCATGRGRRRPEPAVLPPEWTPFAPSIPERREVPLSSWYWSGTPTADEEGLADFDRYIEEADRPQLGEDLGGGWRRRIDPTMPGEGD